MVDPGPDVALRTSARTLLGAARAADIAPSLTERAGQLRALADVEVAPDQGPDDHRGPAPAVAALEVARGRVSVDAALTHCLESVDAVEHRLRAWASIDVAGAREQARRADARSVEPGPLTGVVVGVKDNIDVRGHPTRAGTTYLSEKPCTRDAFVVDRLRRTGALVLGKTRCTELATNDPAVTLNAWSPAHTPGGSSAGSGVAVATRMCDATIDTQTAGDVLRPAAFAGVVGFKPSYGWMHTRGVLPVAWSVDTLGLQARSVADVALVAGALAASDGGGAPAAAVDRPPSFGVIRDYFADHCDAEVREHWELVIDLLARAGARVVDLAAPIDFTMLHAAHRTLVFAECATAYGALHRRRADVMGERTRTLIELGMLTPATSYVQAQRVRRVLAPGVRSVFGDVDAVLVPPSPSAPPDRSSTGSSVLQIPWTLVGCPAISLPTALNGEGLPMAMALVGDVGADDRLLQLASWCEEVLRDLKEVGKI